MTQPDPTPDDSRPAADLDELERIIAAVDAANLADAGSDSGTATRSAILAAIGAYEMAMWRHGPSLVAEVKRLRTLAESLAERCAGQSEALSRRAIAERRGAKMNSGSKYHRTIRGVQADADRVIVVDVYSVLTAFGPLRPAVQHAVKKLLCAGLRGKGSELQDLRESIDAIRRAIEDAEQEEQVRQGAKMSRTESALSSKARRLTRAIVDNLYTNAIGEHGARLAIKAADERDLGGWCKEAAEHRIFAIVLAAMKFDAKEQT